MSNILNQFNLNNSELIQYYPCIANFKKRISQLIECSESKFLLSAGSDLMISNLLEAMSLITKNMILQSPAYPGWSNFAALRQINIKYIISPNLTTGYQLTDIIKAINSIQSSIVVIVNPHSPSGFCFSLDEMLMITEHCKHNNHFLIIDECYIGFSTFNHKQLLDMSEQVVLIRSYSKSLGLAGARISITFGSKKMIDYLSNWNTEFSVAGFSLKLLQHLLERQKEINLICQDIVDNKQKFITILNTIKPSWQIFPSSTNFVVINVQPDDPKLITKYLETHKIIIGNLEKIPGYEKCIRITIGDWSIMQQLIGLIKNYKLDNSSLIYHD